MVKFLLLVSLVLVDLCASGLAETTEASAGGVTAAASTSTRRPRWQFGHKMMDYGQCPTVKTAPGFAEDKFFTKSGATYTLAYRLLSGNSTVQNKTGSNGIGTRCFKIKFQQVSNGLINSTVTIKQIDTGSNHSFTSQMKAKESYGGRYKVKYDNPINNQTFKDTKMTVISFDPTNATYLAVNDCYQQEGKSSSFVMILSKSGEVSEDEMKKIMADIKAAGIKNADSANRFAKMQKC